MPVSGAKPKAGPVRHRVKPVHEWTEVLNAPFTGGPDLPAKQPDGRAWPAWTRRWWRATSRMPHCSLWSETDWEFAFQTAIIVARFHEGDIKAATELRNREKVLGTTVDFRRDLRIRYVDTPPEAKEAAPNVASLDDYRAALED